jgi:hypothetical protein
MDEVEPFGIPHVQACLEAGETQKMKEKWQIFWDYFKRQWITLMSSWNVSELVDESGEFYKIQNRTNNALECYNQHFNDLFSGRGKPSMMLFLDVLEREVRTKPKN